MDDFITQLNALSPQFLSVWLTAQVQTAAFLLLIWAVDASLPRASARFRYALWMTGLVKVMIPPVIGFPASEVIPMPVFTSAQYLVQSSPAAAQPLLPSTVTTFALILLLPSLLLALWAGLRSLRLRASLRHAQAVTLDGYGRGLRLRLGASLHTPLAFGILRPTIYLTPDLWHGPAQGLRSVILHEHEHIRRRDGIVVLLQTLLQIVFALNPMVWVMNLRLHRYREQLCDSAALRNSGIPPQTYGRLLLDHIEAQRNRVLVIGTSFFETRHGIVERISHLFVVGKEERMRWKHYAILALLVLVIAPLSWKCGDGRDVSVKYPVEHRMETGSEEDSLSARDQMNAVQTAEIVGGMKSLSKALAYPPEAASKKIQGTVVVEVEVAADASVSNMRVIKSVHPVLDKAAVDAMRKVKWIPATFKSNPEKSTVRVPIKFALK
jgi:TonB family protein